MFAFVHRLRTLLPGPRSLPPPVIPRYKPPKQQPLPTPHLHGLQGPDKPPPPSKDKQTDTVERLPVESSLKPVQEYPQLVYRSKNLVHVRERGKRKIAFVWGMLKREPGSLVILSGTMGGVWLLCLWEAYLNVRVGAGGMDVWRYAIRFANANTFTALTNTSVAPETIAASLNLSPNLFDFVPVSAPPGEMFSDPHQAENRLHALYARAARGMAAGYIAVASLLRLLNLTMLAGSVFRERTLNAREPPFSGIEGRVFRLCGQVSDTLTMSLAKDKEHLLPIIEDPAVVRHLLMAHTRAGTVPIAWSVRESEYGNPSAWEGLASALDESALLTTKSGERLLYLEADTTMSEDALRLGSSSDDLSIDDASIAFRMIEDLAHQRRDLPPFRSVRVVLGDVLQKNSTGRGTEYTLRQRVRFRHEVDVLVDSKIPILSKIVEWADKNAAPGWNRKLVFETDSQEYYHNLANLLKTYGFSVLDISDVTPEEADKLPRLIYYRRTAGTVNALRATLDIHDKPPPLFTVIDTKEGLDTLGSKVTSESTTVICSAEIYDNMLREIRTWARMGYTPQQIQRELDARSSYVARIAATIADAVEELKKEGGLKKDSEASAEKRKDAVLAKKERGDADEQALAAASDTKVDASSAATAAARV